MKKVYICIDLKSFYASVECCKRNLNPLTTNLVVADKTRTEKTICLAVSPSLKQYGIPGRARLFEVLQKVNDINRERKNKIRCNFIGESFNDIELKKYPKKKLSFIIAPPKMADYLKWSSEIYSIYLKYLSKEDIFVYSIDEIFADITPYLKVQKKTPEEFVTMMVQDVYYTTGITATAGIGSNLYLAKVAMDIVAKKKEADEYGVRIAELDEISYRRLLWTHKPLTDFWRIGKGISKRLEKNGLYTMGDIARCSLENENKLFRLFGVQAELIIDHAWGWEPCTMKSIKNYHPKSNSLSSSQVLKEPYNFAKTKIVITEMIELLSLDLVRKKLLTNHIVLSVGYDQDNTNYDGEFVIDFYGREIPKPAHGTIRLDHYTSSSIALSNSILTLFYKIVDPSLLVRRIHISLCSLKEESNMKEKIIEQINLFETEKDLENKKISYVKEKTEKKIQIAVNDIQRKYGKNSLLKGINLLDGGTTLERNKQIGGHQA